MNKHGALPEFSCAMPPASPPPPALPLPSLPPPPGPPPPSPPNPPQAPPTADYDFTHVQVKMNNWYTTETRNHYNYLEVMSPGKLLHLSWHGHGWPSVTLSVVREGDGFFYEPDRVAYCNNGASTSSQYSNTCGNKAHIAHMLQKVVAGAAHNDDHGVVGHPGRLHAKADQHARHRRVPRLPHARAGGTRTP